MSSQPLLNILGGFFFTLVFSHMENSHRDEFAAFPAPLFQLFFTHTTALLLLIPLSPILWPQIPLSSQLETPCKAEQQELCLKVDFVMQHNFLCLEVQWHHPTHWNFECQAKYPPWFWYWSSSILNWKKKNKINYWITLISKTSEKKYNLRK